MSQTGGGPSQEASQELSRNAYIPSIYEIKPPSCENTSLSRPFSARARSLPSIPVKRLRFPLFGQSTPAAASPDFRIIYDYWKSKRLRVIIANRPSDTADF